jgi:hypothetical protein
MVLNSSCNTIAMAPLLTILKTNHQKLPAAIKRANVAVCTHVTQGEGNHGGAVRARSRLLHVPARQAWQRKLATHPLCSSRESECSRVQL